MTGLGCNLFTRNIYFCQSIVTDTASEVCQIKAIATVFNKICKCDELPNPVNGSWGPWQEALLSPCSKRCGTGRETYIRQRSCNNPRPSYGGDFCKGNRYSTGTRDCNTTPCGVQNGGWSQWSQTVLVECTSTCGGGVETIRRTRECDSPPPSVDGANCPGDAVDTFEQSCATQNCIIDGGWSDWVQEVIVRCSVTCGGGTETVKETRTCNNPAPQNGGKNCVGNNENTLTRTCANNACTPVDGGWSDWVQEVIVQCSVTCGGGTETVKETRTCNNPAPQNGGKNCVGDDVNTFTRICANNACAPVDGGWSDWVQEVIVQCSVTCGGGTETVKETRTCNNPAPQNGGKNCVGDDVNTFTRICANNACAPVDGGWSDWVQEVIVQCSVTCGGGTETVKETRTCNNPAPQNGGKNCVGDDVNTFTRTCANNACAPVDGGWSDWVQEVIVQCSVTCGGGTETVKETRTCNNPAPQNGGKNCVGDDVNTITRTCVNNDCPPVDGGWSDWVQEVIVQCSVTCGGGTETVKETRTCNNPAPQNGGKNCVGDDVNTFTRTCANNACPPVDGGWSDWVLEVIVQCSVTCGGGEETVKETRTCNNPAPQNGGKNCVGDDVNTFTRTCANNACPPVDGGWSEWVQEVIVQCSVTCGGGEETFKETRTCNNPAPQNGGKNCVGDDVNTFTRTCANNACPPVDGGWSDWVQEVIVQCSVTCGGGEETVKETRTCNNPAPQNGGKNCVGDDVNTFTRTCANNACAPVHGGWGNWIVQVTTPCDVTCGGGVETVTQTRRCDNPKPANGGFDCYGSTQESFTRICNSQVCGVDGQWTAWVDVTEGVCATTCNSGATLQVTRTRTCTNPAPIGGGLGCVGNSTNGTFMKPCNQAVKCPQPECGPRLKIIGGNDIISECSYPFIVGIRRFGSYACGGTLIAANKVLTAAHCVERIPPNLLSVEVGKHCFTLIDEDSYHERNPNMEVINVANVSIHASFNSAINFANDVAVLLLDKDITESECRKPLTLRFNPKVPNEQNCTVVGWGVVKNRARVGSNVLQEVELTVYDSQQCRDKFPIILSSVDDKTLCAANGVIGGKDACQGDSGSPLLCREGGQWMMIGVVSSGVECALPKQAGLYMKTSSFYTWIVSQFT